MRSSNRPLASRWAPRLIRRGALAAGALVVVGSVPAIPADRATQAMAPGVVPQPVQVTPGEGVFPLGNGTAVCTLDGGREATEAARYFIDLLARSRALHLRLLDSEACDKDPRREGPIVFAQVPGMPGAVPEGYSVNVNPGGVLIEATSGAGLFYGAVTLWQLLPGERGPARIAAQHINDAPAYAWRGLMLDSSRHFQSPEFVKSMIDWMALHKLNVFHWHLTDDQGWRLEIRKYPRLTSVGAWRTPAGTDGRYGGFYTQAQVRDIVAFAAARHVEVVPEIDLPGHAQAAIAAYPALGSTQGPPPPVSARWGIHKYLFNPEPSTIAFLEDVLTEVMELFPSHYIHVGGDEAVKDQWNNSPAVQARARALGISNMDDLQAYFTQEIGRFLASHGRRLVGWDEILTRGLSRDAVVMSWRGTTGAHAAAVEGNDTVLSPWPTLYFDNRQSDLPTEPPGRMQVISLEDVYRFDPRDPSLTPEEQAHVLGLQANLWTEHIRTEERVEWMAFPRAAAVAEVAWSPASRRQWPDFLTRLAPTLAKLRTLGLQAADSAFAANAPKPAESARGRRTSRELSLCSNGVPLLLEPAVAQLQAHDSVPVSRGPGAFPIFALDIMNPCWIYHDVDLSHGAKLTAAVGQLPFNFEIGADAQKIRVGDARSSNGELEIRVGGCDGAPSALATLPAIPRGAVEEVLQPVGIPAAAGRHDICIRFARPKLDPMWALDWVEISQ